MRCRLSECRERLAPTTPDQTAARDRLIAHESRQPCAQGWRRALSSSLFSTDRRDKRGRNRRMDRRFVPRLAESPPSTKPRRATRPPERRDWHRKVGSESRSSNNSLEELDPQGLYRWDNQGTVQEFIALLAGGLGDQHTPVTSAA